MPANPLRHIFSDTVADLDGVMARTHLCPPGGSYGGVQGTEGLNPAAIRDSEVSQNERLVMSRSRFPPDITRLVAEASSRVRATGYRPQGGSAVECGNLSGLMEVKRTEGLNGVSPTRLGPAMGAVGYQASTPAPRGESQKRRTLCVLGCCCGGQLLILWMKPSNTDPSGVGGLVDSTDVSPYKSPIRPPLTNGPRLTTTTTTTLQTTRDTSSVSTGCSAEDQAMPPSYQCPTAPSTSGGGANTSVQATGSEVTPVADGDQAARQWNGEGCGAGDKLGRIQFNLSYDFQEMTLNLRIICAVDLPVMDLSGTSDPYVKVMLLPDKKHKLVTNIKRKNLNPRWNETFAFEGFPYTKLMSRILHMQVLDYDRFSRDDPIGEVCLPLSDVDLVRGQTFWKSLQPCKGHTGKLGELLLSLCYQPTAESITVVIIEARGLKSKDINGLSDPYVKIWMLQDGKKLEKRKTAILQKTLNPVFNEMFMFRFPYERVRNTSLVISVMDHDRMGRNEMIGQVILSSKSGPMEVKHWNEMFAKTRQPAERWHVLRNCR